MNPSVTFTWKCGRVQRYRLIFQCVYPNVTEKCTFWKTRPSACKIHIESKSANKTVKHRPCSGLLICSLLLVLLLPLGCPSHHSVLFLDLKLKQCTHFCLERRKPHRQVLPLSRSPWFGRCSAYVTLGIKLGLREVVWIQMCFRRHFYENKPSKEVTDHFGSRKLPVSGDAERQAWWFY